LKQRIDRDTAVAIHEVLFEQFVQAHDKPPRRLILDFDATATPLHHYTTTLLHYYTAIRKAASSMVITTTIASCRCMSSVVATCW